MRELPKTVPHSDKDGNVEEGLTHGIASRGYATRHMKELAQVLQSWQSEHGKGIGSTLYSDIGGQFYPGIGWLPHPEDRHFVLPPLRDAYAEQAAALKAVLQAAQAEAAAWRLDEVKLWEPSPLVKRLVEQSGLDATWGCAAGGRHCVCAVGKRRR
ncbi:hypothetical protein MAJ_09037, partial [Metarhizium majus ARSEF 297]